MEFKDTATGEKFDVVQDGDLSPDPIEELDGEAGRERVIARAEREVREGGRRGTGAQPALTVPREIKDERGRAKR